MQWGDIIMLNVFISAVVCFFAIFGIIQMFKCLYNEICKYRNDYTIVVTVKNQQDNVEEIIRATVWKSLNGLEGSNVPEIIVVDLGSEDETMDVLLRLSREYEFVKVLDRDEYIEFFEKKGC